MLDWAGNLIQGASGRLVRVDRPSVELGIWKVKPVFGNLVERSSIGEGSSVDE